MLTATGPHGPSGQGLQVTSSTVTARLKLTVNDLQWLEVSERLQEDLFNMFLNIKHHLQIVQAGKHQRAPSQDCFNFALKARLSSDVLRDPAPAPDQAVTVLAKVTTC